MKIRSRWERLAERWRVCLPIPRYLRQSRVRAMRERIWFVSHLQPRVVVTIHLKQAVWRRSRLLSGAVVFLQQRLTAPMIVAPGARPDMHARAVHPLRLERHTLASFRPGTHVQTANAALPLARARVYRHTAASPVGKVSELALRLARRSARVDDLTPATTRAVTRRTAAEVADVSRPSRSEVGRAEAPHGLPWEVTGVLPGMPTGAAPVLNVEQLADQVVRHLDRRLIASRERLGRI